MNRNIKRTLVATSITFTLLVAVAGFALGGGPILTPTAASVPINSTTQFHVVKSNDRVTEKWWIIESRSDPDEYITQNGTFHAGSTPGLVRVYVSTSDYNQPSYSLVQVQLP